MYTLGFGIWAKFLFQILSVKSKSPTRGQFYGFCWNLENQLCNPPLCKKNFSNMPFLMSHEGVFHRGSKLAKSKKSVPHHLCGSATIPLKSALTCRIVVALLILFFAIFSKGYSLIRKAMFINFNQLFFASFI